MFARMYEPQEIKQEEIEHKTGINTIVEDSSVSVDTSTKADETLKEEIQYFQCSSCIFKEKYEYFGSNPPQVKNYILLEDAYVIEDPFLPPKQGKIVILGAHCVKCRKSVCKDVNCSLYFDGTYCIECAKENIKSFPPSVQEKLNRVI
ncbi:hypothetical protein NQ314_000770 [Rhamnusium bicolor]|uniref:Cysteine-rich DPF motif domain-containing protein 1 n=1 Tax=Rhamnusium bicolor TaxID=1586634 RepID=A0AAV8ZW97_9CUCU|nr:hypothetical protein NQ314_000770 [Rhamnusium bicolor]